MCSLTGGATTLRLLHSAHAHYAECVTKNSATIVNADEFLVEDIPLMARPEATITIGSRVYTARAPKVDVFREVSAMIDHVEYIRELSDAEDLSDEEARELEVATVTAKQLNMLTAAAIVGKDIVDEHGTVIAREGGFLRRCLSAEDWELVYREWKDDDSDVDHNTLFIAARKLQLAFKDYFLQKEKAAGLPSSEPKPRKARKPRVQ